MCKIRIFFFQTLTGSIVNFSNRRCNCAIAIKCCHQLHCYAIVYATTNFQLLLEMFFCFFLAVLTIVPIIWSLRKTLLQASIFNATKKTMLPQKLLGQVFRYQAGVVIMLLKLLQQRKGMKKKTTMTASNSNF